MRLFGRLVEGNYESVNFRHDAASGLQAIVAIHSTRRGPALGGARMRLYANEDEALDDVLRLSRGMTYKAAAAGLQLGGGKAVIWADAQRDKTEALLRAFGRFVDELGGRYITAEDYGTSVPDMHVVRQETRHVVGVLADPSPYTAIGTLAGIRACLHAVYGSEQVGGRTVVIQGLGKVGYHLAELLAADGARLWVYDINPAAVRRAVQELDARPLESDPAVYQTECDVFAPCAIGAVLNEATVGQLRCAIVAGSANNQLATPADGDRLHERGILYAPDYIINAGGLICVDVERHGFDAEVARRKAAAVGDNVAEVIRLARREHVPLHVAADRLAEARLAE